MRAPQGKGCYIWMLRSCAGGDPVRLAAEAQMMGFSWVAVKVNDAHVDWNMPLLPVAVEALKAAGVQVWGWGYCYGGATLRYPTGSPTKEAETAAAAVLRHDLAGYLIDAEAEYKRGGAATWANRFMSILRPALGTRPIGLSSYRFPTLHPELPWAQFLRHCDFHAPQVYWQGAHNPRAQLERSVRELRSLKDLPVVPAGSAYSEHGWAPTVAELNEFDRAAFNLGLPGVFWWSWQHAEARPEWWRAIAAHVWTKPEPPELSLAEKVDLLWQHHPELWAR